MHRADLVLRTKLFAAVTLLLDAMRAAACPFCDGGPSGVNDVKATIFGPDFWSNVGLMLLPFAAFALVTGGVHRGFSEEHP